METNVRNGPANVAAGRLAEEVEEATAILIEVGALQPDRWWTARELRAEVQNGWAPAAVMIAINRLVSKGHFERDDQFRVRMIT